VLASNVPDASGYCHGVATQVGACGGGSIRFPAVCAAGRTCAGPAPGSAPGAAGICIR
jgi:hypothetical protein